MLSFIRNGLVKNKFLSTDLNVKETAENEAVVNTMRDLHRLISNKYLPAVQSWIQVNLCILHFITKDQITFVCNCM